jgi:hypothetical protein
MHAPRRMGPVNQIISGSGLLERQGGIFFGKECLFLVSGAELSMGAGGWRTFHLSGLLVLLLFALCIYYTTASKFLLLGLDKSRYPDRAGWGKIST